MRTPESCGASTTLPGSVYCPVSMYMVSPASRSYARSSPLRLRIGCAVSLPLNALSPAAVVYSLPVTTPSFT